MYSSLSTRHNDPIKYRHLMKISGCTLALRDEADSTKLIPD